LAFTCAVGKGKDNDTRKAVLQAAETCRKKLGPNPVDLLILFISSLYDQETALEEIRRIFPDSSIIGCSSAGEIYAQGPDEQSIALLALSGINVAVAYGGDVSQDAYASGKSLGQKLRKTPGDLILTFGDGLAGDGAAIIRGIHEGLCEKVSLLGGVAGDDTAFQRTDLYLNDKVLSSAVVGARLEGDFHFGIGVHHGWEPVGLPVQVTKSIGNRLIEINGMPAIKLYDEYFGEYTERLRSEPLARLAIYYPLGLVVPESDEYLLRAPLSVEENGAIRLTAEVPEGTSVRLMIGSVEGALAAARIAAQEAVKQMQGRPPKLALLINAVARRRLFGHRANEEICMIRDIIGEDVPVVGFYTYGEIAPLGKGDMSESCFHNETIVILTLG